MKEALCKAFCNELRITEVPVGLAVATAFRGDEGDSVSFYIVKHPAVPGQYRIEDDGATIPHLEASGVDFSTETRGDALTRLLEAHGVDLDEDEMLLHTQWKSEADIPTEAMRFLSFALRINDFLLITKDRVASSFKEDATRRIVEKLDGRALIKIDQPVSNLLSDTIPDMVIQAGSRTPVAVFFGTSPQRVNDAIFLQMQALLEVKTPLQVVALLERENVVSRDLRRRASNRLSALPIYHGDEETSVVRIEREVIGPVASRPH